MKIAFTSCMDAIGVPDQPIWERIQNVEKPDVLMLLGDQIYMDWGLGKSKRRRLIDNINTDIKARQEGLKEYAQDMHNRYEAQWAVTSFRQLVRSIMTKPQGQIYICWDDHDFAWNNSNGLGVSTDPDDAVTPWQVKAVTRHLLEQFKQQLTTRFNDDDYPSLDLQFPLNQYKKAQIDSMPGIEQIDVAQTGSVKLALLDERWNRWPRSQQASWPAHALLGTTQWDKLNQLVSQQNILTVIAGGLPMKHSYFLSHQAWGPDSGNTEKAYPEYDLLLAAIQSPTIYLAGDIHKNEFAGYLHNTVGMRNHHLLHVCASPAAIRSQFIAKFEPAYGVLDINSAYKKINIQLLKLTKTVWKPELRETLRYAETGWQPDNGYAIPNDTQLQTHHTGTWDAITANPGNFGADADDLSILCRRARTPAYRNNGGPYQLAALTDLYADNQLTEVETNQDRGSAKAVALNLSIHTKQLVHISGDQAVSKIVLEAFNRAIAHEKKSVVLFIHGFNNSFEESIDQAYSLRMHYPEIEPILLSWPGGWTAPSLDAGYDAKSAYENAQYLPSSIIEAIDAMAFYKKNYGKNLKCMLLARSYGAQAVESLLSPQYKSHRDCLSALDGIVLSAPAIALDNVGKWTQELSNIPAYVLVNQNDFTLNWGYRAIHKTWAALGSHLPNETDKRYDNLHYFNCTDFPGVSNLHNIINAVPCHQIRQLHATLLSGSFNSSLVAYFNRSTSKHKIWTKS